LTAGYRPVNNVMTPVSPEKLAASQQPGETVTLHDGTEGGGVVRRTVLPGGLRVVTETMPTVRSVSFGVWVAVGSRDETRSLAGASHYLEHLLFKGTNRRSALDISAALDAVGGELNAFTAKEYTCFYARVLDEDLPLAVDVISDLVTSSVVSTADVDSERGVILEEIAMHDDDPGDQVHDAFAAAVFGDAPLGRPILGTPASIEAISRGAVDGYYRDRYRPERMVVAAAGNVDHDAVVSAVRTAFDAAGFLNGDAAPEAPRVGTGTPIAVGSSCVLNRATEQANLVLGVPGIARNDDRRFALAVLNAALGGGMSSRLFQEVREKRGLAYSVYSYASQYADVGTVGVYAGCLPSKVDEVLAICREQLQHAARSGLTPEELTRGKGQIRGSLVLGLEDTGSRMSRIGKGELVDGWPHSVDESLAQIHAVTLDEVNACAAALLTGTPTLAVIGPFEESHDFAAALR
jgi:predicted Zn-dependent peptidase